MSVTTADLVQSTFHLVKLHQKLHQDRHKSAKTHNDTELAQPNAHASAAQSPHSQTDWIAQFKKISIQWLKIFNQAPELISSFYFLPVPLKLNQQRYLKTNILLLNFINELNIPKALAIELLTASAIRDAALYALFNQTEYQVFELLKNKSQTKSLANIIYKSANKSAQLLQAKANPTRHSLISQLLTNQYEFLDGSGINQRIIVKYHANSPIALGLFSFCCHLVNLDTLYPKLTNWTLKLKFLTRHWFQKIDTYYLNTLYKKWHQIPLGSLINYHHQAGYLLFKYRQNKNDYAIIYAQDNLHTCQWDNLAIAQPGDFSVLPDQSKLLPLYKTQLAAYMSALELNFIVKPKAMPKIQLRPAVQVLQLINNFRQAKDPIDYLSKQLNQPANQAIAQDLIRYAQQKRLAPANKLSINQAIMMLGSDAVEPWLVQNAIEKPVNALHHQSMHWLQSFQIAAQQIAATMAADTNIIHPQTAQLLVSLACLPYFYHSKLNVASGVVTGFAFNLSTDLANIFSLDTNYAHLSQQIAANWQQASWLCQALVHHQQLKPAESSPNKLADKASCLLKISFFASVLIYQPHHLKQMNDLAQQNKAVYDELEYSMSQLGISWQKLLTLIDDTSVKHHFFCPIAN